MALIDFSRNPVLSRESRLLQYNGDQDSNGLPVLSMRSQDGSLLDLSVFEPCNIEGFPLPKARYFAHPLTRPDKSNFELLNILNGASQAVPLTAEVSPFIGFSRTILYADPNTPSRMYKLGGVGICTQDGNNIVVEQPDPDRRMGRYIAGTKNMNARVFEPDGSFKHDENNTILGVYTTPGIIDKVQRHRLIARALGQNGIKVPEQVLIASKANTDYYVLGTAMPLSINFAQLGNIEAWALSEGVLRDPLLTLAGTFLRFNMLAALHDSGFTHNQFTATNARINVTESQSNTVMPNDFTDSRRLSAYPEDRYFKTAQMPYPIDFKTLATLFDFEHALHLTFKEVSGGEVATLRAHLIRIAAAAIAGMTNTSIQLYDLIATGDSLVNQFQHRGVVAQKDIIKQAVSNLYFPE